ncbi:MAG: tetratricopeptide repeat protein [Candidatus Desulfatibia sp.]|uniref:tetratricopeptide repeat protein n=1 Tax=Candidatus Desulfatibia sp. TaxID=3101189 RepID=UPI002F30A26C
MGLTSFKMEEQLVHKIVSSLDVKMSNQEKLKLNVKSQGSFHAAIYYSKGIGYMDAKNYEKAKEMFKEALKLDPNFEDAKEKLDAL